MRELIKQQLRDSIAMLGQAEAILDSRSKMKDEEAVQQLLGDMQYTAITVGTTIEEEEGDDKETVRHLEDYCELLWQYLNAGSLPERFRMGRTLAGKRGEISACLERELEGRLNVVFLLCKAERWNAMEELWKIAGDNPAYDCQVLVSSYRDSLPGGSVEMICDEQEMFPETVDADAYEMVDMEVLEPDLVFIDGPYTGTEGAGVTPEYDFDEVREHAGVLIYMPVYDNDEQVREADCMLPQVERSDLIIVPTEAIRKAYAGFLNRTQNGKEIVRKIHVLEQTGRDRMLDKCIRYSVS